MSDSAASCRAGLFHGASGPVFMRKDDGVGPVLRRQAVPLTGITMRICSSPATMIQTSYLYNRPVCLMGGEPDQSTGSTTS